MLVGYGRVCSTSQSLDIQLEALSAAGCEKVFSEKMSGRSTTDRDQLALALDFVREGDTLCVTREQRQRPPPDHREADGQRRSLPLPQPVTRRNRHLDRATDAGRARSNCLWLASVKQ